MNRLGARVLAPLGAIAVLAILLLGVGSAGATSPTSPSPETPSVLATIPLVDAIAANSTMVFAQGVTNCSQIWGITPWGNVSLYATVPIGHKVCSEGALTLAPVNVCGGYPPSNLSQSPVQPAWGNGGGNGGGCRCHGQTTETLYDVVAGRLYEITDGGTNVTTVATFGVPDQASENMGLAYDQVGLFGHDLIVTSSAGGKIWLVNASSGNVTLLTSLHTYIGGPAVAPSYFGPYGGDIVVAAKNLGEVVAVSPTGNVSVVANWSKANAVTFPSGSGRNHGWDYGQSYGGGCGASCSFGRDHDVLFVANYSSGAVEAFSACDLQNFSGEGFVAGGLNHGIAAFAANGSTTLFASQTLRLSDITFISCFPECHGRGGCGGHGHGGDLPV